MGSPPVSAADNLFYSGVSTNLYGGSSNVFSVGSVPGTEQIYPAQPYGAALYEGLPDGTMLSTGFEVSNNTQYLGKTRLDGVVNPIYHFPAGAVIWAALYGADGNYYGTSNTNGATGYVFRITPAGVLTQLFTSPTPYLGTLMQASDGNFYGSTQNVGANNPGTIYRLTPAGHYTVLHAFPPGPAGAIDGLIEGSDGKLYGSVDGNLGESKLFSITKSGRYTTLYTMSNVTVDGQCGCNLVQGSDGILYGTAVTGGPNGFGLVFALDVGLPKPKPHARAFHPTSGSVGTRVRIWGQNLLSASVGFNGVPATTVSNSGANYVWATVPSGATTGPITVTTPGGRSTTKTSFAVQ